MKKIYLLIVLSIALLSCSAFKEQQISMPGGIYTAKMDEQGERILRFALSEMGRGDATYEVSLYKKQVVSGMNYFYVVKIGDNSYEIKVYEDLNMNLQLIYSKKIPR